MCRYSSRILQIPFVEPQVGPTSQESMNSFKGLSELLDKGPSMVGSAIRIEQCFITDGQDEIMALNQTLISLLGHKKPRVILGYCILYYFTKKVK